MQIEAVLFFEMTPWDALAYLPHKKLMDYVKIQNIIFINILLIYIEFCDNILQKKGEDSNVEYECREIDILN